MPSSPPGIGFILGLFTRWLGLITCFQFIVAVWMVHSPDPFPHLVAGARARLPRPLLRPARLRPLRPRRDVREESCYPAADERRVRHASRHSRDHGDRAHAGLRGLSSAAGAEEQHCRARWPRTAAATSSSREGGERHEPSPSSRRSATPTSGVHLKRIVAARPARAPAAACSAAALDWLYTETETNRVDLDLFVENERARRAYEKLGFIVEGRLRDYHRSVDGRLRDALIMSILRKDWAKRHRL